MRDGDDLGEGEETRPQGERDDAAEAKERGERRRSDRDEQDARDERDHVVIRDPRDAEHRLAERRSETGLHGARERDDRPVPGLEDDSLTEGACGAAASRPSRRRGRVR